MPVSVAITVADPPAAPPGYTLCAFEVRTYAGGGDKADGLQPVAVFPGSTDGFEGAANVLVKAVAATLKDVGVGLRLAAVAWWVDKPLTECEDGCERMASVYDAELGEWGEWLPEERIGVRRNEAMREHMVTKARQTNDISRMRLSGQNDPVRIPTNRSDKP